MKFSKCLIKLYNDRAIITFKNKEIVFKKSSYDSYAYFKKRIRPDLNKWLIAAIHFGLIFIYGYISGELHTLGKDELANTLDLIFIPILTILCLISFFELILDAAIIRYLYSLILKRRRNYLIVILKSGKELEIPVRNEKELFQILEYLNLK